MKSNTVFITGGSGFVGGYLLKNLGQDFEFSFFRRNDDIQISEFAVLHCAGLAHDLKNVVNPQDYYDSNTELTKRLLDAFLLSNAKVFIGISSVKAVADFVDGELTEHSVESPSTHYGKSKLLAEKYLRTKTIPNDKRIYFLRPCMIHGKGNKGNLSLLYNLVSYSFPWPLAAFSNLRSFCGIDNLCFVIREIIERDDIPSGIYNIADDVPVSTNDLVKWMSEFQKKRILFLYIPQFIIKFLALLGDFFRLPLNTENLQKLTQSYIVSNKKIREAIGKPLPFTSKEGLLQTFEYLKKIS